MIRRTILEWEKIDYGPDPENVRTIPQQAADRLAAVAAASPLAGRGGSGVLEHGRKGLRARGVVGVIASADAALEILPKIDVPCKDSQERDGRIRARLVHMLAVALDIRIDAGQVTALDWQRETLLEILIRIFSGKLADAVREGMPRRYAGHEDDLAVLRGRLDVRRQFTKHAAHPARLACRYDALTPDISMNRILKAAIIRLAGISRSSANQRRLRELAFVFADIATVPVAALRWDDVVLDRTNLRWRELLNMARLLLGERFQSTSSGSSSGFSLLFEMHALFEEYIARMVRRALAGTSLHVVSQGGRIYCLDSEHGKLFQTRPDILVKDGPTVVQVIDTKWKRIASRVDDSRQGVSQADIYQMMAYGRLYGCDRLTLLYPHHAGLPGADGMQSSHGITNSDHRLEVVTFNVADADRVVERLRTLASGGAVTVTST